MHLVVVFKVTPVVVIVGFLSCCIFFFNFNFIIRSVLLVSLCLSNENYVGVIWPYGWMGEIISTSVLVLYSVAVSNI